MEKAPLNFRQRREFGDILNATFTFIGQEIRPLSMAIIYYSLPILVLIAVLTVYISIEQQNSMSSYLGDPEAITSDLWGYFGSTLGYAGLTLLLYTIGIGSIRCTVNSYIKLYVERGSNQFTNADVGAEVRANFFPVLVSSLLIGLLVFVGSVFCLVPGVWLGVSLCLFYIIQVFEDKGTDYSFKRSFELTKQDWWTTLGLIIVVYLIVYFIQIIFSIPQLLLGLKTMFFSFKNSTEFTNPQYSTTFYVLSGISGLLTTVILSIPVIAMAFQYFNLVEMKERPSLQEKINQIQ